MGAAGQGLGHESFSAEKVLNPASHRRAPTFESIPASADASLRVLTSTLCESLLPVRDSNPNNILQRDVSYH